MLVLVLNTGSSSVKYELIDPTTGERHGGGMVEEVVDHEAALASVVAGLAGLTVDAVGHRVVHGGEAFSAPTIIDDDMLDTLRSLVPLAPLHNPANITGIETARRLWPDVPQVAVFDTAFHRTLPVHAYRYAVPADWYERHGVRRYGFHGTSHAYVAGRAAEVLGRELFDGIVAHLGNGASITAVSGGRSVDTSMGLSPLEGLVMGTRSGDVDPTVVTHVAAATGRPIEDVFDDLNNTSGLRGLCGVSDMREITARAAVATTRLASPSTCSPTGSRSTSVPTSLCWAAGATRSCSPAGSVSTAPSCALRSATGSTASASCSTPSATSEATKSCRRTSHRSPCS